MLRFLPRPLFLLALLLLTAAQPLFAQAPAWQDAVISPGVGPSASIAVDAVGNTYVTGDFTGTAIFGAITLTSAGQYDLFIAKRTLAGVWEWATQVEGSGNDRATGVAVDSSGVVVTGYFDSPTLTLGALTLSCAGNEDIFVAKLTPSGVWQWANQAGGSANELGTDVALDGSGSAVVTGYFSSSIITFGTTTLTNTNTRMFDLFVAKLTPTGTWQWGAQAGGSSDDYSEGVAVDNSGNVVVTGYFYSPTITFGTTTLTHGGGFDSDLFVAKLAPTGAWQWVTQAEGASEDISTGIAVDNSGNVAVTGFFFGPTITFGATVLTSSGGDRNIFVAKLTPTGAWQWASQAGGSSDDFSQDVAVDNSGNVVITGLFFSPTISFGATTLTNFSAVNSDLFVAKLTPMGAWQWATLAAGSSSDGGTSVAVDGSGGVMVTGYFTSATISFGATTLIHPVPNPTPEFNYAIFLARLSSVTGLPEAADAARLSLWPNPAHGTVQLSSPAPGPVQLLDALGRPVRTWPLEPTSSPLDLSGLPPGLYTVRAGTQARRLVVE